MHPILFYGVPEGCSLGSIVALEWSGQPYRLCRVQMPEVVSGAAYRRLNPVGETPTLMTARGDVISESLAILNHIGAWHADGGLAFAQGSRDFDRLNVMLA
ncbi:MAG: glutathione S-transferase N-terminal domain-containing protein, partial [Kiloniellaceae bacterium]